MDTTGTEKLRIMRVYEEGVKYLREISGLTDDELEIFYKPSYKFNDICDVCERMVLSTTNNRNLNVIQKHLGHPWSKNSKKEEYKKRWQDLKEKKLEGFDPYKLNEKYGTSIEAWKKVKRDLGLEDTNNLITLERFCKSVISVASFLTQFKDLDDFRKWVEFFANDDRAIAALPMILEKEIEGMGFALACDFLKELGYVRFPKPDTHLIDVCMEFGLSTSDDTYSIYKAIVRCTDAIGVTPYQFDRVFYLIGSGNFDEAAGFETTPQEYKDARVKARGITNRKKVFLEQTKKMLQEENLLP
jgi:hypothetical protein